MRTTSRMVTIAAVGSVVISMFTTSTLAQVPAVSVTAPTEVLKTPWGEPDLQGIWIDEFDTPLQRPADYADRKG